MCGCKNPKHSKLINSFLISSDQGALGLTHISVLFHGQRVEKCILCHFIYNLLIYCLFTAFFTKGGLQMIYNTTRSVFDIITCEICVGVAWSVIICVCKQSRSQSCHIRWSYKSKYWSHRTNHELTVASFEELTACHSKHQHTRGLKLFFESCSVVKITQTLDNPE